MFITLLLVTFVIALLTTHLVVRLFAGSIRMILDRLVSEELSTAWERYIRFAIYVVGISSGVPIWQIEQYVTPRPEEITPILLTTERWTLEVYRTVIGSLQGIAWVLLLFFIFALIAYVIVRAFELRRPTVEQG